MKKIVKFIFILFIFLINTVPVFGGSNKDLPIAAGVVPHHLLAKEIIEDFFEFIAKQELNPDTVILLSPDHFNSAVLEKDISFITINWGNSQKEFCNIPLDLQLLEKLSFTNHIKQNTNIVLSEFGITNLFPFIKKYLPKTKIVPILIPERITQEEVKKFRDN